MNMTAEQWNKLYPIGTLVTAYPGCRPEDDPHDERLITRTRSKAEVLCDTDVVWVEGHSACIALSHVDPISPSVKPDMGRLEQHVASIRAQASSDGLRPDEKERLNTMADKVQAVIDGLRAEEGEGDQ